MNKNDSIDLNLSDFKKLFDDCLPSDNTQKVIEIKLKQKKFGHPVDSQPIYFDLEKINKNEQKIQYLFGQISTIHRGNNILSIADSIQKYDGTKWTTEKNIAILFFHLGVAGGAITVLGPNNCSVTPPNLLPTLSPLDPNFDDWYSSYEAKIFKLKHAGQEPADD